MWQPFGAVVGPLCVFAVLEWSDQKDWKGLIWYFPRKKTAEPKELARRVKTHPLLIGDIATGINSKYHQLSYWQKLGPKCSLKLANGTPATQYVFGHYDDEDDLVEQLNKLEDKTTIRHTERPNEVLNSALVDDKATASPE